MYITSDGLLALALGMGAEGVSLGQFFEVPRRLIFFLIFGQAVTPPLPKLRLGLKIAMIFAGVTQW